MTAGTDPDEPAPSHSDPHRQGAAAEQDDHEPSFRERLLNISTMDVHFRTLTAIVVAQVAATSLLVLLSDYSFGDITVRIIEVGEVRIGMAHYVASVIFLLVGLTLFVAGLGRADVRGTMTLLGFFFLLYLFNLIVTWLPLELSLTIFVTIVLMFVASMLAAIFIRRAMLAKSARGDPVVYLLLFLVPWTAMGLYFVISQPGFFYTMQFAVGTPFILLFPFAAIDWSEIADSLVKGFQRRLHLQEHGRRLIVLSVVAAILPIGVTAYALSEQPEAYFYRLVVLCVMTAALAVLLRIARFRGDWPTHFPWAPTAMAVVVIVVLFKAGGRFFDALPIALFIAGVMSVLLCLCGRNPRWRLLAPASLLGTLIGFAAIYFSLFSQADPDIVNFIVLGAVVATLYAAFAVVLTVGVSRIRSQGVAALRYPLQAVLTLNASLVAVYALAIVYGLMLESSQRHVVEAFVVAVALLSELFLSGHSVTNIHSEWFPRNSRLFMYFGFVTFTLAYTLSVVALHGEAEQLEAYKLFLNPENAVLSGLLLMGPAMLWALFVLRMGRWLASQRATLDVDDLAAAAVT